MVLQGSNQNPSRNAQIDKRNVRTVLIYWVNLVKNQDAHNYPKRLCPSVVFSNVLMMLINIFFNHTSAHNEFCVIECSGGMHLERGVIKIINGKAKEN